MATTFKSAFKGHKRLAIEFFEPTLCKQSFQDECDINTIMAKYQKTGLLEHVGRYEGRYGDFISSSDYHTSLNEVLAADEAFMSLPSSLRARFDNDPSSFLAFVENPDNRDEMIDLGLTKEGVKKNPPAAPVSSSAEGTENA